MEDDTQNVTSRGNKSNKTSEGKGASPLGSKKRGVQRSRSGGVLSKRRTARTEARNVNRSKSEDDGKAEELAMMSKATESSSTTASKKLRSPKASRKAKKSASNNSTSPTRKTSSSVSPQRKGTSPLARKAAALRNSISPKERRGSQSKSPTEGRGRPANRRSSLTKLYSWWDLAANKGAKGDGDRSPSPPPAPPPPPASIRTARMNRKRSDSNVIGSPLSRSAKSAVVTRRKKGRSKSYDDDENDVLEVSKKSLLAQDSMASPLSRSNKSAKKNGRKMSFDSMDDDLLLGGDGESKTSSKKNRKVKKKKQPPNNNNNYATLLDSPSTSSLASTLSGEGSLKDRFQDIDDSVNAPSLGDLYDNFLGELFDIKGGSVDQSKRSTISEVSHDMYSVTDSEDDTAYLETQEVKWIEVALDNPAIVVIKMIPHDQDDDNTVESFIVPAGTSKMNTLVEDFAHTPFKSIIEGGNKNNKKTKAKTKKKKKPTGTKNPSLGDTIGRDRRSVQNRPPDDRTNCTLGTAESEQTLKVTNHHQHADPRISDTVHELGYEDLKTGEEDHDGEKLDGTSTHSRSSIGSSKSRTSIGSSKSRTSIASNKSSKSLPTRRVRKKSIDNTNSTSSSHEPRRALRRSMSGRRQQRTGSRDAPRRTRSGRAALRRTSSHHGNKSSTASSSEIDEFMAMTKESVATSPNKDGTDGTMSTATESTMTTFDTRSRRSSVGPANLNPQLIENFQLTF